MVTNKRLDKISENEYTISTNESIQKLGIYITNNKQYEKGIEYLEKYNELNKENKEIKLVLIQIYLTKKQYQKIFPILDELLNTNKEEEQKDYILILYLLSIICPYPDKYKEKILNLTYDDILYKKKTFSNQNKSKQNEMRCKIFQNKFHQAEQIFKGNSLTMYSNEIERNIIKKLLDEAKRLDKVRNSILEEYVKNKNYENIISFIKKKKERMKLSLADELIYKITTDIIRIKETGKIPRPQVTKADNLKTAVEGKNYYLALQLNGTNTQELKEQNIRRIISLLLIDINKLISNVLKEYKENKVREEKINKTLTKNLNRK